MDKRLNGVRVSRRTLLGTAGVAAGAASMPMLSMADLAKDMESLKAQGWERHYAACQMCGGRCGVVVMQKKGEKPGPGTVRVFPNPTHPQHGYCGRGAQAIYVWDHPMRLRKPLKRVGERGEGKFEEISWDQALNEIAAKVKDIVAKDGEHAVVLTSHTYTGYQQWFAKPLGTPNVINHSSMCNSASGMGRKMTFGPSYGGVSAVDPDYEHVRYLILMGRTLNCGASLSGSVAKAKLKGAKVVFVDPRMPSNAFADSEWLAIKPGTDAAFLQGLIHVGLHENLVDYDWLAKYTNAPNLVREDNMPLVEADMVAGGAKHRFAVIKKDGTLAWHGTKRNDKGQAVGFDHEHTADVQLSYHGEVTLLDGRTVKVQTALDLFKTVNDKYTPAYASKLTGIREADIVRVAREFFEKKGVVDDGWFSARNGQDCESFALMSMINLFTGVFDQVGGLVVPGKGGAGAPGIKQAGTKCTGPTGVQWEVKAEKPLDKLYYPEGIGTLSSIFDAIKTGKPYPIRALFMTGCAMFHREANVPRMIEAFKGLDLIVAQDIFPQDSTDWADYILPSTYYLENAEYCGVSYALHGNTQANRAHLDPPEGCEARHDIWQFMEILRRMDPALAARAGYTKEIKTRAEWKAWWDDGLVAKAWAGFIAKQNAAQPGKGDRIAKEVIEQGWSQVSAKQYGVYPYVKPMTSPTGKPEIVSFYVMTKPSCKGILPVPEYIETKSYKQPKPMSDEFYVVSGKDGSGCSGMAMWTMPSKYISDRSIWMNPVDAERLGIENGDKIELESLDTGVKGQAAVKITNRVRVGCLYANAFQGGITTKKIDPRYEWVREGINTNWLCTGLQQVAVGNIAGNCSVRVKRL